MTYPRNFLSLRRAAAERYRCLHTRLWWDLAWSDRIVEATVPARARDSTPLDLRQLVRIGARARGVLGERAAAWQIVEWTLPIIRLAWPDLPPRPTTRDLQPLVDVAVGGALVTLRTAMPDPPADPDERDVLEQLRGILVRGALVALRRTLDETSRDLRTASRLLAETPGT